MGDSPRSAKRRKLETVSRNASSPTTKGSTTPKVPVNGTLKRPTRRASSSTTTSGQEPGKIASPAVKVRASRHSLSSPENTPNSTLRKRGPPNNEEDIYNDFDGALEVDSPAKRLRSRVRGLVHFEGNSGDASPNHRKGGSEKSAGSQGQRARVHQGINGTPKITRSSRNLEGSTRHHVGRSTLMNEVLHEEQLETFATDDEDELASGPATPSRGKAQQALEGVHNGANETANVMPSDSTSRRSTRFAVLEEPDQYVPDRQIGTDEHMSSTTPVKRKVGRPKKVVKDKREDNSSKRSRGSQPTAATLARRKRNTLDYGENNHVASRGYLEEAYNDKEIINMTPSRRKRNYTDHVGNGDGVASTESDDEAIQSRLPGSIFEQRAKRGQMYMSEPAHEMDENVDRMSVGGDGHASEEEINPFQVRPKQKQVPLIAMQSRGVGGAASSNSELKLLQRIMLERITVKRPAPLIGLDDEYKKVYQLVEHTVVAGEGNSMLLIGARGSGKTTLVGKALSELSKDHREDFHVVKLSGFIHTDDKLALREIWRQLGKEMDIEEDSLGKNYADTMSTLLALLSHPSEQTGQETEQVAKAVVFVMDEFDLFASHPRQTLLYNLFDIAQSRKAPIAVLGLTTKIDVAESLEKRVKSRFSHRYVHLSLAKSFTAFQDICKAVLLLQPDALNVEERAILSQPAKSAISNKAKTQVKDADLLISWNNGILALFANKIFLTTHLAPYYYRSKSISEVLTSFLLPTSLLTVSTFPISPDTFTANLSSAFSLAPPDSKLALLSSLSFLQLALLISAARLDVILDTDTCNFNMAYAEYVSLASKAKIQSAAGGAVASGSATKVWGRDVARMEWERLVGWDLLVPVIGGGGTGAGSMIRVDVALEEIAPSVGPGIDRVLEKWCRQI
ncbi:hypothetical protein AOQ84DRAFT_374897 [Glonium stellatum]|uniref:Origin recognition complex subunit 4 n=1 Tax=Glonium stellatum TaxID=574774 RepID=A0A8E2JV81_9PEZI|nr:hypothetical protein AOQ84DRAFT_374897 [Glonium stellatum]